VGGAPVPGGRPQRGARRRGRGSGAAQRRRFDQRAAAHSRWCDREDGSRGAA